jgi:hypothetical protein
LLGNQCQQHKEEIMRRFRAGPQQGRSLGQRLMVWGLVVLVGGLLAGCSSSNPDQSVSNRDPQMAPAPGSTSMGQVRGRVTTAAGEPLAEAVIAVPEGSAAVPDMALLTGLDGSFVLSLPPGTFRVEAHKDGYRPQDARVTLAAGETVSVSLVLAPE